jgi:mannosyl-oligosaccharide alpha-1,2-mannosidase
VDALSTAIVMRQPKIVNEILGHIAKVDFTKTATEVSLFETTIRYLGGMLSGYDLLNGPYKGLVSNPMLTILLNQSKSLANTLAFAFNTTTGIPYNNLNITAQKPGVDNDGTNGLATIGTLVLEWQRLSDLTGDPHFGALAAKGESYLLNPQPVYNEPWPGLVGTTVNISTGQFTDASGGWVGGDDSGYEYMIKMFVYDAQRYAHYRDRWLLAADSSIRHLTSHPSTQMNTTFLAEYNNQTLILSSQHLACFDGGNFILGGLVTKNQTLTNFGIALTAGCHQTYTGTATGIGPEVFGWDPAQVPAGQAAFFAQEGFYITDGGYDLRPEVIESYYYAYRATKDKKYQDWAWSAFVAINATTRTGTGFSQISDVNTKGGGQKLDNQESFLFAELLKYSYLIHANDSAVQVNHGGANQFVFNTECQ